MATEYFYFPTEAAATKTLTFEDGGGSHGHLATDGEQFVFNQIQDVTIGGIRMAKNLGDHFQRWEYTVYVKTSSTSYTDYDDVISFIGSTYINGAQNTFVWKNYNSSSRTVNLIADSISFQRVRSYTKINFQLEEENT